MNLQHVSPVVWDWHIFGTAFGMIFLAQLPGKSALTALVLSSRYSTLPVLFGAAIALAAHSVIAVAAGGLLSLLPARPIRIVAGLIFVVSAIFIWRGQAPEDDQHEGSPYQRQVNFTRTLGMTLSAVFVAEWGDLTQLATAALAARYREPVVILAGAILGLWAATGIAILIGRALGRLLRPTLVQRIAATAFAGLGIALVLGVV